MARCKVSTIPPGVPFVDALAAGLLGGGAALAEVVVLLPTRRACLALREAFLRLSGGGALLLPRMMPLGDVDPDDIEPGADDAPPAVAEEEIPPAIPDLERRLILTRLIVKRGGAFARADQAVRLAGELARLLDQVETERLSFDALAGLVPADYAEHWEQTLEFLGIVTAHWPGILAERGLIDPAERRNRALDTLAARWRAAPPEHPVVAAGSTGSIPATADLLTVIAGLPRGEVVLPGLDRESDDAVWDAIYESHPQFGLKRLLARLGIDRAQVADWPLARGVEPPLEGRAALLNAALRPADATDRWCDLEPPPDATLDGLERIDCAEPQEEARVIALKMRAALEDEGTTAALVTRDRALARRVAAELLRWDIAVDDSGGQPLADTAPGSFLRLTAALVAEDAAPVPLLAALKHPLAAGGLAPGAFRAQVCALERAVLRGPRPGSGFSGLTRALRAARAPAKLRRWLDRIAAAAEPFAGLVGRDSVALADLAAAHLAFAEALAASDGEDGASRLWKGDAGEAAAAFFTELIESAGALPPLAGRDYAALVDGLIEGRVARPRYGRHPRLNIWGPLEARLQHADVMILGGLNEASWPPEAGADPWLSRPMRAEFGLPAPERRIGLSAHDFVQCAAARRVVLTRSQKVEGTPVVPSRWLARLDNLLHGWHKGERFAAAPTWRAWQGLLDRPEDIRPTDPPAPRPPVEARPRKLSVTRIETWRRDPYAIYARHILELEPLDPIDADPGAADRGQFIHNALDRFVRAYPESLPDDAYERLLACGRKAFGDALDRPGVRAFWWPRFERIAAWFIAAERARRDGLAAIASEVIGRLKIEAPAGAFTLTAKADRIERRAAGGLVVIDYKTGGVPSGREVERGLSPQLPLEAAIAQAGGFAHLPAESVDEIAYWRLTGGEPAGEQRPVPGKAADLAADALAGLERLVAEFDDAATPYLAVPDPDQEPRFNDYAHLARLGEWAGGGDA